MRELKELLAQAIAHANETEPQPARRREVVLFWLKVTVTECKKSHDYKQAFMAMTLIRLVTFENTINPIWKALCAAAALEDDRITAAMVGEGYRLIQELVQVADPIPPTPNRGVRSSPEAEKATTTIDVPNTVSSADEARDKFSFGLLSDFIGSHNR